MNILPPRWRRDTDKGRDCGSRGGYRGAMAGDVRARLLQLQTLT